MIIRKQLPGDNASIEKVTIDAFKDHPFSNNTEQTIIRELRENDKLTLSLVAEFDGIVVGHVAFSAVSISDGSENWFGLGPVSVSPDFQNKGVGSKLIQEGLKLIRGIGANGCVVLGEPDYYARFGFEHIDKLTLSGVPPKYFQARVFQNTTPSGAVEYDIAFDAKS